MHHKQRKAVGIVEEVGRVRLWEFCLLGKNIEVSAYDALRAKLSEI